MKIKLRYDSTDVLWQGVGMNGDGERGESWDLYFNFGFFAVDWHSTWKELAIYF